MLYLGGKARIGKKIANAILSHIGDTADKNYIEPFLGGGSAFKFIAPHFVHSQAGDIHSELIMMWQAAKDGYAFPTTITEEQYQHYHHIDKTPSAIRGFIGFGCSFGAKWWGGFARSSANGEHFYERKAARSLSEIGALMKNTKLQCQSFDKWDIKSGDVVYCDPPYYGTTGYKHKFDSEYFWSVMNKWCDLGATVFVSEYVCSDDRWSPILEVPLRVKIGGKNGKLGKDGRLATEKLFVRK